MVVTGQAVPSWNRALAFVAGGIGCVAVATVVTASLDPSNYFYYWPSQMAEWKYPIWGVVVTAGSVIVETLVTFAVLAKYRRGRIWMRGLVALCLLLPPRPLRNHVYCSLTDLSHHSRCVRVGSRPASVDGNTLLGRCTHS